MGSAVTCINRVAELLDDGGYPFDENNCTDHIDAFACYRGSDQPCTCNPDRECPQRDDCHPAPNCPDEVIDRYPGARCIELTTEDIGPIAGPKEQCLCGCEACVTTCDGRGPIWSQIEGPVQDGNGAFTFDLQRHLPSTGNVGFYVRGRGWTVASDANDPLAPFAALIGESDVLASVGQLPTMMDDRFEARLFPSDDLHRWSSPADRPALLVLVNNVNTFTHYEIDCVIPFIVD